MEGVLPLGIVDVPGPGVGRPLFHPLELGHYSGSINISRPSNVPLRSLSSPLLLPRPPALLLPRPPGLLLPRPPGHQPEVERGQEDSEQQGQPVVQGSQDHLGVEVPLHVVLGIVT